VRAHLDAECTADEVDREAGWCQEEMGNVIDATAKKIKMCARSKRWWNVFDYNSESPKRSI